MLAWRCSDVAKTVDDTARKIDRAARSDLGPAIMREITDASLDHEKQFVFVRVHMRWRTSAWRSRAQHHGEFSGALFSSHQHGDHIAKKMKIFTRPRLD